MNRFNIQFDYTDERSSVSTESATLELDEAQEEPETNPKAELLEQFDLENYSDVTSRLSEEALDDLRTYISSRKYGWKVRATYCIRAKAAMDSFNANVQELESIGTGERPLRGPRAAKAKLTARDRMRDELTGWTDEQLEAIAGSQSVSYESFMKGNDKDGLIEAILDEMIKGA